MPKPATRRVGPARRRRISAALVAAALTGAGLVTAPVASAAPLPVLAGLTVTPSTTTVGTGVRVVGTATNTTDATVQAALGVDLSGVASTDVSGSRCTPRHLGKLIYCGVTLPPNTTATIAFTATPPAPGSYDFRTYARIQYSPDNSFAYATLTVS
jgi:hypothetical protein